MISPLRAYATQKCNARRRGIDFLLTFKQWIDWWGEDFVRRGVCPECLQMQRIADTGPYALWNIRKGHPRDNAKTRSLMVQKLNAEKAAIDREAALDAAMYMASADEEDVLTEDDEEYRKLGYSSSRRLRYSFRS